MMVEALAEEVLSHEEDLLEGGFLFNEFLEAQGTRLHFLSLLVSHLEQSADALAVSPAEPRLPPALKSEAPRKRKPRTKKLSQQASTEGKADDA